jgi:hypothetical protein
MALTGPRATKQLVGEPLPPRVDYPVKAAVKIWQGSLVQLHAGYARPADAATGRITVGMAEATVDNTSGADGAVKVPIRPGVHRWGNSGGADLIAQAQVGLLCYAVDDQTVAKTDDTGARSSAGIIAGVDSGGVWVLSGLGFASL